MNSYIHLFLLSHFVPIIFPFSMIFPHYNFPSHSSLPDSPRCTFSEVAQILPSLCLTLLLYYPNVSLWWNRYCYMFQRKIYTAFTSRAQEPT